MGFINIAESTCLELFEDLVVKPMGFDNIGDLIQERARKTEKLKKQEAKLGTPKAVNFSFENNPHWWKDHKFESNTRLSYSKESRTDSPRFSKHVSKKNMEQGNYGLKPSKISVNQLCNCFLIISLMKNIAGRYTNDT